MRRSVIVAIVVASLGILVGVMVSRALNMERKEMTQVDMSTFEKHPFPNLHKVDEISQRLAKSLHFQTISHENRELFNGTAFLELHDFIRGEYPLTHKHLERKIINSYSLLYIWKGKNFGTQKDKPFLVAGHLDVVSVPEDTLDKWSVDPFEGVVKDGFIWGRGALDDKNAVFGILEGIEALLSENFSPDNTVYFAFGHDEEIGGTYGAKLIAQYFSDEKIKFEFMIDEGMPIGVDLVAGLPPAKEVALIAVAEKGYTEIDLVVNDPGGHASTPPDHTAIGILAAAIKKIEDNPLPLKISDSTTMTMLYDLAPEMSFSFRFMLSNFWLFRKAFEVFVSESRTLRSAFRTSMAVTIIEGGIKSNVLPTRAKAVINSRIIHGDSPESVAQHIRDVVADDRVQVLTRDSLEPSPVSSSVSRGFDLIVKSVRQVFGGISCSPALMIANTDTRHYWDHAKDIYRFEPSQLTPSDISRIHGIDERISVANYMRSIQFHYYLILNANYH